ncbi:MAG: hypothetical protein ACK2T6_08835 [Anaerolineae bacterium]
MTTTTPTSSTSAPTWGRSSARGLALPQGSLPGAEGAGDLAIVRFKTLALGDTELDLTEVLLETSDTTRTEVEGVDETLTITDAEPTPTGPAETPATPGSATATPGPTDQYLLHVPRVDRG